MAADVSQRPELVQALTRPEAYPHPVRGVRLVETHVSYLFFTGESVYKVKKAVDYGFLDFTNLEKRHYYCQREVELNSRLSPDVYLGVVPVTGEGGQYRVEGPGEAVEYAVKMRQLPQDRALSELLKRGRLTEADLRRVAERIAEFHSSAAYGPDVTRHGDLEATRRNVEENFQQTEKYVGVCIDPDAYEDLVEYSRAFLEARAEAFRRRADEGRIRDGHGDLHSANIFLDDGIHVIDCIEFNDRFRCLDVAEDIAFLAMDLDFYGRPDLSKAFVGSYIEASGDTEIHALLNFFKAYRAYVRGKVTSFRLQDAALDEDGMAQIKSTARDYFDLARRYALADLFPRPALVMVIGLMGTGKTLLSEKLSRRWGLVRISSDVTRKELAGMQASERRSEPYGQGIYAPAFSRRTYDAMYRMAGKGLASGKPVVLDASFRDAGERRRALDVASRAGADAWVVECVASDEEIYRRLTRRAEGLQQTASDGRWELFQQQKAEWQTVKETPERRHIVLDTSGPPQKTVRRLVRQMFGISASAQPRPPEQ